MTPEHSGSHSRSRINGAMLSTLDSIVRKVLEKQKTLRFTPSLKVRAQIVKFDTAELNCFSGMLFGHTPLTSLSFSWLAKRRRCLQINSICKQFALLMEKGHGP